MRDEPTIDVAPGENIMARRSAGHRERHVLAAVARTNRAMTGFGVCALYRLYQTES